MANALKRRNQVRRGPHGGMQLVLCEDVAHVGKQGEVVEVKDGYGRNYLIPNGLAIVPSAVNLKMLERHKVKVRQAVEARIADLKVLAGQIERIAGSAIVIEANATEPNEAGERHLYGSVGAQEISKALKARNLVVEPTMVDLEHPIKDTGLFQVPLHLGYDIRVQIQVLVAAAG